MLIINCYSDLKSKNYYSISDENYKYIYSFSFNNNENANSFVYGSEHELIYNEVKDDGVIMNKKISESKYAISSTYLDNNSLIFSNQNGDLFLRDIRVSRSNFIFNMKVPICCINEYRNYIILNGYNNKLLLYDIRMNNKRDGVLYYQNYHNICKNLESLKLDELIISGNDDGRIRCWNIITGTQMYESKKIDDIVYSIDYKRNDDFCENIPYLTGLIRTEKNSYIFNSNF